MRGLFLIISILCTIQVLGQDTIRRQSFTGNTTILLMDNGTFKHYFEYDGGVDFGFGNYFKELANITLEYKEEASLKPFYNCLDTVFSNSIFMNVFNLIDSSKMDFYYLIQGDSIAIIVEENFGFKPIKDTLIVKDLLKHTIQLIPNLDSCSQYCVYFFPYNGIIDRKKELLYFDPDGNLIQPMFNLKGKKEKFQKPLKYSWHPEFKK